MTDKPLRKVRGGSVLGNDWEQKTRSKIQGGLLVKRLILYANGKIKMEPAQVTASLGLLKKVLPDTVFVEHSGEVTSKVIRTPAPASDLTTWQKQYAEQHNPKDLN